MGLFALALLPLVPAYFFLKPLRLLASQPPYLGYFLFFTAALLFLATKQKGEMRSLKWKDVVWIGVMQSMALIPGISRSGATIATARLRGWGWVEAARFSFLLAIPTIIGGQILETARFFSGHSEAAGAIPLSCYVGGFAASFGMGLVAVRFVFSLYEKGIVRPFAWYCLGMGLLALVIFHYG